MLGCAWKTLCLIFRAFHSTPKQTSRLSELVTRINLRGDQTHIWWDGTHGGTLIFTLQWRFTDLVQCPSTKNDRTPKMSVFFRVLMLPHRFVTFCKIWLMERQKRITFKKKFIKKYLSRRYVIFKSKQVWNLPYIPGISHGKSMRIGNLEHRFPLGFLWKYPRF